MARFPFRFGCLLVLVAFVALGQNQPRRQPGARADWLLDLGHSPRQPRSGEAVQVTARLRPGLTNATLRYQVVEPGAYIELQDAAFTNSWQTLPMALAGQTAVDQTFRAELPGTVQKHRRLVRYRLSVQDAAGKTLVAPAFDQVPPNEAYFVCDGIPAWTAALDPRNADSKRSAPMTFPSEAMARVQAYYLLGKRKSIENATWLQHSQGKDYRYTGTLVVDGEVFDHVSYRARGGVWRYAMGKNMWKFSLPGDRGLQARDDFGRPYPARWTKINLRACIQQGDYGQRGEQGMFESVGFRLFNLAGVAAPFTHWIQLRIVDEPKENPPDQFRGDFWGLYLALENEDGRFLKDHNLPSGNLFKMMDGSGYLQHHGTGAVTNLSDLSGFMNAYHRGNPPESWWRTNFDLSGYYSYRAISECIHHYDVDSGKNYDYYYNPDTHRWQILPWDIDLTWADNMYGGGEDPFKRRVLSYPAFRLGYQNRLREIRDLLFNPEQAGQIIDEFAAVIWDPSGAPSLVEADRRKWDYHPVMAMGMKAGQGLFYEASSTGDFRGMVQLMKDYVRSRGSWIDSALAADSSIPAKPTVVSVGPAGFPAEQLRFRASGYKGAHPFAAVKWRLAEVAPAAPATNSARPMQHPLEINALWESAELPGAEEPVVVPGGVAMAGHTYRVRARMKDATGRWSHWSAPAEFVAR